MDQQQRKERLSKAWGTGGETHCACRVLNDMEVGHVLLRLADDDEMFPCGNPHCEGCRITRSIWWDLFDSLPTKLQARLVEIAEILDIELPHREGVGEHTYVVSDPRG